MSGAVEFDGPCPFLTCFAVEPHGHAVCEDCGAVRHGNAYCKVCRSHWPGGDPFTREESKA